MIIMTMKGGLYLAHELHLVGAGVAPQNALVVNVVCVVAAARRVVRGREQRVEIRLHLHRGKKRKEMGKKKKK